MTNTFCEDNSSQRKERGGILSDPSNADSAFEHLSRVINSWQEAFYSPDSTLLSEKAYTKFFDFDKELIQSILEQDRCVALRIFPGFDENGKITAALVGINDASEEILNTESNKRNLGAGDNVALLAAVDLNADNQSMIACCPRNGKSALFG
ncbi:hypothetical protein [Spirosoma endbachense]|uniref:Uncharacterized protein n=1 Tax=Spirosoma endbachense TaxID=2666025 RepID=A0A6P1VR31_9BACT|nr:hypothetical protein [Spirosoma endbachense]QHV94858.1 hypothetical protein GJR95_07435 [Spirosoma endbachense]